MKIDDSLDRVAGVLDLDKEQRKRFKIVVKITILPIICLFVFITILHFFFSERSWATYLLLIKILTLVLLSAYILLFSTEDFEWRVIGLTIATITILIDIMAHLYGWYTLNKSFIFLFKYNFGSHVLAGLTVTILFTNFKWKQGNKIIFIVVLSMVIAFAWELLELIIIIFDGYSLNLRFYLIDIFFDIIAHTIGTAIGLTAYLAYKYFKCPSEYREGIMCKLP